jgi:phosphohistidine phosphatase
MKEKERSAGVILTSPAFRAAETALIFAGVFRIPSEEILMAGDIYYKFNLQSLLGILARIKEEEESVTLFGHNPSFTELAGTLSKEGCNFMQKCAVVGISFKISTWSEINHNLGNIEYYLKP